MGRTLPVTSSSKVLVLGPWDGYIGLFTSLQYSFIESPKTHCVARGKPKESLQCLVTVVRLKAGVEVKTGLCFNNRASSAGVQPDSTWLCISNQLDLLYLRAKPIPWFRAWSERNACKEHLTSDDLAAQNGTTCIPAICPGISRVHLGPILQWTDISHFILKVSDLVHKSTCTLCLWPCTVLCMC